MTRRKYVSIALGLVAVAALPLWLRERAASRLAGQFVNAINAADFDLAKDLVVPKDQPFPDKWANPAHWGEDGALQAHAEVVPMSLSDWVKGVRHVIATVYLDAEPREGITTSRYLHSFVVTSNAIRRIPKPPDSVLYPVTIRPAFAERDWTVPDDLDDVPAIVVQVGGDEKKSYCLIGNIHTSSAPQRLLVVMPGGDGGAGFSPFVRRIYKHVLDDSWLVAQIVAPRWSRKQQIVWPMPSDAMEPARFTTDELFDAVVEDVASRSQISGPPETYLLAWSSSGPAAYAIALRTPSPLAGAFIAMSVFREHECPPGQHGTSPAFYLLQSPDDRTTPFSHAENAQKHLSSLGRRVKLTRYSGGHGWQGQPFQMLAQGIHWLRSNGDSHQADAPEPSPPLVANGEPAPPL